MSNPLRGQVELVADGRTYTLRLGINQIVELETKLDRSINEIVGLLNDMRRVRLGTLRAVLWASLLESEPDITLEQAGEIIGDVGTDVIGTKIGEALAAAFPPPEKGPKKNPRQAGPAGTGKTSK